jgi:hypothetical protein
VFACSAACGVNVVTPIDEVGEVNAVDAHSTADAAVATDAAPEHVLTLDDGLVGHWKLDESRPTDVVLDATGQGNSGLAINGPTPSPSVPRVMFADHASRSFDGMSQYIAIGNSAGLNFGGAITMAAWVNVGVLTPTGCQTILGHGYHYQPMQEVSLRLGTPGCSPLSGVPHSWAVGSWDGADHFAAAPLYDLDMATWIHIAGVYDGAAWHLYRNGEEIAKHADTVGAMLVDSDWGIGARAPSDPPGPDRFFNGLIDEVRIYRRALSGAEIVELYHQ